MSFVDLAAAAMLLLSPDLTAEASLTDPCARFGIVLVGKSQPGEDARARLEQIGAPFYFDYTATTAAPPGYTKLPMARLGDDPTAIASIARANPSRTWLLGNEPDQPDQDGAVGAWDERVRRTWQLAHAIKDADPNARLVGPNMLSTSRDRLEHFRGIPFDATGVHVYVPEEQLPRALDGWPHPLWVTEFGSGSPDPAGYVRRAIQSFHAAGVERWFLFSSDPIPQAWGRSSGNWITTHARDGGILTDVGRAYACQ